jgi:hypothetical protein
MRLSGSSHPRGWWMSRVIRGARLDRNPLRRGIDRLETCLLALLFIALAVGAPFAVRAASNAAYVGALQARQQEMVTRHQVQATLSSDAAAPSGYGLPAYVLVPATWTSLVGVHRSGDVPALPGSPKGTPVTVWVDDSTGYLDGPPLTVSEAASQADAIMVGVIVASGIAAVCGAAAIRQLVNCRRMAAWEADWVTTAPAWNRQRW